MTNGPDWGLPPSVWVSRKKPQLLLRQHSDQLGLVALFLRDRAGLTVEGMQSEPLANRVAGALTAVLPDNDGFELVNEVDVWKGWGDVYIVVVHCGLHYEDAHPKLERTVHTVVDSVMPEVRHRVKIVWASESSN